MPGIWWTNKEIEDIDTRLTRIEKKIDVLLASERRQEERAMAEQEEIANLIEQVEANKDVVQSAVIAIQGLIDRVAQIGQELQDAINAGGSDVSPEIKEAAEKLKANTDALREAIPDLAGAVKANT
jgi:chromosome segregation ATPase